ncbi:MAG: HpcH/HpaI aldolase/citrate lyase family protein [Methyloligellaceae bacterium]
MLQSEIPIWRSLLYVPANNEKFWSKAHQRRADAIVLDLEDSVPQKEKDQARKNLENSIPHVAQNGADVLVRINRPLQMTVEDIAACVAAGANGLMIAKTQSADHVRLLSEYVRECELRSSRTANCVQFYLQIETASALMQADDIARSDPRVVGLAIGSEDLAMDVEVVPSEDFLLYPKSHAILAAISANVIPYGLVGTVADYKDLEHVRRLAQKSKRLGAKGATCVHPSVVPILNEVFTPSAEEISHAEKVVAANEAAEAQGLGAFELDGKMIDVPIVDRARKLLAFARKLATQTNTEL